MGKRSRMRLHMTPAALKHTRIYKITTRGQHVEFRWTMTWPRSPSKWTAGLREAMKGILEEIGQLWHTTMLPKHFTPSARQEYRYARRNADYLVRKQDLDPAEMRPFALSQRSVDLVLTGKLYEMATGGGQIKGTSKSVRVGMEVPWYVRKGGMGRAGPDMHRELTMVSNAEAREMYQYVDGRLEQMWGAGT